MRNSVKMEFRMCTIISLRCGFILGLTMYIPEFDSFKRVKTPQPLES